MRIKKIITERLTASLLLALFMVFSIELPFLCCEVNENNPNTGKLLILQPEYLASISNYSAPTTPKIDFGKYRISSFHLLNFVNCPLLVYSQNHYTSNRLSFVPIASVPVYLLVRVLRN